MEHDSKRIQEAHFKAFSQSFPGNAKTWTVTESEVKSATSRAASGIPEAALTNPKGLSNM